MPVICPSCGNHNREGALYCDLCKAVFKRVAAGTQPASASPRGPGGAPASPAATTEKSGMVWNLSIRCSPDRLEIDRRVAGLGKVTGIAFLIAGGLGALGSLGSGSIVGFLFALAWAACG